MWAIDTSAWIEWLLDSPLGGKMAPQFASWPNCVVPTIVQLELAKWGMHNQDVARIRNVLRYTGRCKVVPLTSKIAFWAARLHRQYGLATADAIIYATARLHKASLLTCDAHFAHLPAVILYRKY
ncbi:type II toxin-antitoxin system VapC family toxin [Rugamonas sp. CCM 8940]|uniref:type II toxin-antitoxin system VapC family toxin n=1 Tax=Rugamonas sp. CCM 8940 TaxID=2765359 RepID=UPI0018F5650C|nr:type II toxin-antitoxin system VapC family toxin [Rugamonas sp. CCM 8940]MBJ7311587.1 type II toxin-antitoxin system VapC family toxin [Rugamonas sp. CCM 8940]